MILVIFAVIIPALLGVAAFFIPGFLRRNGSALGAAASVSAAAGAFLSFPVQEGTFAGIPYYAGVFSIYLVALTGISGVLIDLYSVKRISPSAPGYWGFFCLIIASSSAVFTAGSPAALGVAWVISGVAATSLLRGMKDLSYWTLKKTSVIFRGGETLLVLGLLLMSRAGVSPGISGWAIPGSGALKWVAFICIVSASLVKLGGAPFYSWVPGFAGDIPAAAGAFLPAFLNKLLGVYLLKQGFREWAPAGDGANIMLMIIGALTLTGALLAALPRNELRKILGFHAVSQAGYIILGIGTGTVTGIAGGIAHMFNTAVCLQFLFLAAGVLEDEIPGAGTGESGGVYSRFPVTFAGFILCAAAMSGLPPLNIFVSKWMILQGIVESGAVSGPARGFFLVAALSGSVLAMVSFLKVIHTLFLGKPGRFKPSAGENLTLELPAFLILPLICVLTGVFPAVTLYPALESILGSFEFPGVWVPFQALTALLVSGAAGYGFYVLTGALRFRRVPVLSGEDEPHPGVSGLYEGLSEVPLLKPFRFSEDGRFDGFFIFFRVYSPVESVLKKIAGILILAIRAVRKK